MTNRERNIEQLDNNMAQVNLNETKVRAVIGLVEAGITDRVTGFDEPTIEVMGDRIILHLSNSGRESAGGPWSWHQKLLFDKNNPTTGYYEIRSTGVRQTHHQMEMENYRKNPGSADLSADDMLTGFANLAS